MLSTLSSLLPSSLSFSLGHDSPQHVSKADDKPPAHLAPGISDNLDPSVSSFNSKSNEPVNEADEVGVRKKSIKPTPMNETFIVVRPPPAKSNHPLNLQLQLIPPTGPRSASLSSTLSSAPRQSIESIVHPLEGLPSAPPSPPPPPPAVIPKRSITDISLYHTTSSTSLSSTYSTSSNASSIGARRIVPLYNLHAHNVLQNTILDAGTDAKVAKFTKKGMELIDLTFLELYEVWGSALNPTDMSRNLTKRSSLMHTPETSLGSPSSPAEKARSLSLRRTSTISLQSSSISSHHDATPQPQHVDFAYADPESTPKRQGTKKFFGKIFKKREAMSMENPQIFTLPPNGTLTPSSSRGSATMSTPVHSPLPHSESGQKQTLQTFCSPVLDLQAIRIRSSLTAHRPTSYVWVVRKWLKKGKIDGLKSMISAAGDKMSSFNIAGLAFNNDDPMEEVELKFEWIRSPRTKGKRKRREGSRLREGEVSTHQNESATSLHGGEATTPTTPATTRHTPPDTRRSSPERDTASNLSHDRAEQEAGDESDPEDSETPWNCSISMTRLRDHQNAGMSLHLPHFSSPSPSSPPPTSHSEMSHLSSHKSLHTKAATTPNTSRHRDSLSPDSLATSHSATTATAPTRVKIASLYPAPHHPKIVAQLKVPFPLPDIDIHKCRVHRRKDGRSTISTKDQSPSECILTAEEIKDVICSTAFWLVVREGFGGVGKAKRPGDGWRIRA